ncbi:MAG: accessory gene regulator B family protein [Clostridia bacterium]|nr:accessory gene regulator B family protein [Clostridia bacterium]
MVDKICDKLMDRVKAKMPEVDEERAEVIRYGFELIIGEVPKLLFMFLLAAILGKFKYFLISVLIICSYRIPSGGVHLKTHIGCTIATTSMYLGNVYISEIITIPDGIIKSILTVFVWIFAVWMIVLYAPADTDTVPILVKKDRKRKKIISIIIVSIILTTSIVTNNRVISNMCIIGTFVQTVTITKFIYKIFRVKLGYLEYTNGL